MDYNANTLNSKSLIKSFTHRIRYKTGLDILLKGNPEKVLDYGTGSAYILKLATRLAPSAEFYGYEPEAEMYQVALKETAGEKHIHIIQSLKEVEHIKFDKVCCFEVFEHLLEEDIRKAMGFMHDHLATGGALIISVPIETGLAGLSKNIVRLIIGAPHERKWKKIISAALGMAIERTYQNGYSYSHVGFRVKDLERIMKSMNLRIAKKNYSPVKLLGPVINSQVFYTIIK